MKLFVFCDASSYHNGKPDQMSTCSTLIINENWEVLHAGRKAFNGTTNNFSEVMGSLIGIGKILEEVPNISEIEVVSDSQYLTKGASERLFKWVRNGWKIKDGTPVKNLPLWEKLYFFINHCARNRITLKFTWQKGHKGKNISLEEDPFIYYNEMADKMAVDMKEQALKVRGNLTT
jgi:ribonuclease HI